MLVATKAFRVGVNLPGIRHVVHVGLPENLSLFAQEFGRAGRDGKPAHAHLLVCEYVDMKRLILWTKKLSDKEKAARMADFAVVFQFWCQIFTGQCLRLFIRSHFDDVRDSALTASPPCTGICCTGCGIRQRQLLETPVHLRQVAQTLQTLELRGLLRSTKSRFSAGCEGNLPERRVESGKQLTLIRGTLTLTKLTGACKIRLKSLLLFSSEEPYVKWFL